MSPLLEVRNLQVSFGGESPAVDGIDLEVASGESLGLVGESGSGKSATSLAVFPPRSRLEGWIRQGQSGGATGRA